MEEPKFIEKRHNPSGTYEVYQGSNAQSARAFLKTKEVNERLYYITVKTPEGNWGVDIDGLYLEKLVPFQLILGLGVCEGTICGMPSAMSLAYAAKGISDNFVVTVSCSMCGHKWEDGIRYKEVTIVRCPGCNSFNKVDSTPNISELSGIINFRVIKSDADKA